MNVEFSQFQDQQRQTPKKLRNKSKNTRSSEPRKQGKKEQGQTNQIKKKITKGQEKRYQQAQVQTEDQQTRTRNQGRQTQNQTNQIKEQRIKAGRPKKNGVKLKSSGEWSSDENCKLLEFLTEKALQFRIYNRTNSNEEQKTLDKDKINLILQRVAFTKFKFQKNPQALAMIFLRINDELNPQDLNNNKGLELLKKLNPHYSMILVKIYQLLSLKFFNELVELLYYLELGHKKETIAELLLEQAQLTPKDNTIIQFYFLSHCYDTLKEDDDVKQLFEDWKIKQKLQIIDKVGEFIEGIEAALLKVEQRQAS